MTESADNDVKNIIGAMSVSAADYAKIQKHGDLDVTNELLDAIDIFRTAKRNGGSIDDHLDQAGFDMQGNMTTVDPTTEALTRGIHEFKGSRKKLTALFKIITQKAAEEIDGRENDTTYGATDMFGNAREKKGKKQIVAESVAQARRGDQADAGQDDLFRASSYPAGLYLLRKSTGRTHGNERRDQAGKAQDSAGRHRAGAGHEGRLEKAEDGEKACRPNGDGKAGDGPRRGASAVRPYLLRKSKGNPNHGEHGRFASGQSTVTDSDFVTNSKGKTEFGEITPEIAKIIRRQAAPIKLRNGNKDEGLEHINRDTRLAQLQSIGYKDGAEAVEDVSEHYEAIYQGKKGNLLLVRRKTPNVVVYIKLTPSVHGDFYDVKTATPSRRDAFNNKKPLWERAQSNQVQENPPLRDLSGQSGVVTNIPLPQTKLNKSCTNIKPAPQHDAPMLLKAHVRTYTRKDGTVVQEHEDSRQVHYHAGADIPTHELRAGTFTTPDREAAEQFARHFGHKKIHEMHIEHGDKVAGEKEIIKFAKKIGMYEKGTPIGQYFERDIQGDTNVQKLINYLMIYGFRTATFDDGMSKHPTTVIIWKNAMHPLTKAHVAAYSRTTASGAVAYVRYHEDSRVKAYGRKLHFVRNHADLHAIRQARFGHLPNWGELSDHDRNKILDAEDEVHRRLKEDDAVRDHAKAKERERQKEAMRSGEKVAIPPKKAGRMLG